LFMERTWRSLGAAGVVGLLHPESHFTDPKAGCLRASAYRHMRRHFQFINEARLFDDVDHHTEFGIHVSGPRRVPRFLNITNLQVPSTLDESISHDGTGGVPGIKFEEGAWDLRPHAERVVTVDLDVLSSWAKLFDEPGTPSEQARLLRPLTRHDLGALDRLAQQPVRLADHEYQWTAGWHEKGAKEEGAIVWRTEVPSAWDEVILQGPHFTVGNPFAKQPNENCRHNQDWSSWDLESLPESVIPRTNYQRACDKPTYEYRTVNSQFSVDFGHRLSSTRSPKRVECRIFIASMSKSSRSRNSPLVQSLSQRSLSVFFV
jgi:hypothetical protein